MFISPRLLLKTEQILERIKVGLDAQKSFAKMDEDGNMNNRVGIQMAEL